MTRGVTLNLGLRWEYFGRPVERDDRIASFGLLTGQQVFPGQNGYPRSLVDSDYKDFAPRLGLAWRASDRMTLRTGYGIFYTPDVINMYRQLGFQEPFGEVSSITARPADPQNPLPVFTVDNPLTQATRLATNTRNGIQRNLRDGQVQQWNMSVQYLLPNLTLVEVAYHGATSVHLMSRVNYNETDPFPPQPPDYSLIYPYPQLGSVNIYESRARSNYHALQRGSSAASPKAFPASSLTRGRKRLQTWMGAASASPWVPELACRRSRTFAGTMARPCSIGRTGWS